MSLNYNHKNQPCSCCNCEGVRREAYRGPGIYRGVKKGPGSGGTTTWKLGRFVWDEKIDDGQYFLVVRELREDEPGGHLEAVAGIIVDGRDGRWEKGPVTCTSKRWLEPA